MPRSRIWRRVRARTLVALLSVSGLVGASAAPAHGGVGYTAWTRCQGTEVEICVSMQVMDNGTIRAKAVITDLAGAPDALVAVANVRIQVLRSSWTTYQSSNVLEADGWFDVKDVGYSGEVTCSDGGGLDLRGATDFSFKLGTKRIDGTAYSQPHTFWC